MVHIVVNVESDTCKANVQVISEDGDIEGVKKVLSELLPFCRGTYRIKSTGKDE